MSENNVQRLNDEGIAAFGNLIDDLHNSPDTAVWKKGSDLRKRVQALIGDAKVTEPFNGNILIDLDRSFANRFEFGQYLRSIFGQRHLERDVGLLSWLALVYFGQICQKKGKSNLLKVLSKYRYIPEVDNSRRFYRHLILTPLLLWQRLGDRSLFLLSNPLYESSDAVEQLVSRKDFISNATMIEVARKLYFNEEKSKLRTGAFSDKRPGNAKRLVRDIVPQLSMNYDMFVAPEDKIWGLLPDEFDDWKDG